MKNWDETKKDAEDLLESAFYVTELGEDDKTHAAAMGYYRGCVATFETLGYSVTRLEDGTHIISKM